MAFKLYRIICTLNGKALISGSFYPSHSGDLPLTVPTWHRRGFWSESGAFWKKEATVRHHLQNLCHDWVTKWALAPRPRYEGQRDYWYEPLPGGPHWSRLQCLRVEQIYVTQHTTTTLDASDFMGIPALSACPELQGETK